MLDLVGHHFVTILRTKSCMNKQSIDIFGSNLPLFPIFFLISVGIIYSTRLGKNGSSKAYGEDMDVWESNSSEDSSFSRISPEDRTWQKKWLSFMIGDIYRHRCSAKRGGVTLYLHCMEEYPMTMHLVDFRLSFEWIWEWLWTNIVQPKVLKGKKEKERFKGYAWWTDIRILLGIFYGSLFIRLKAINMASPWRYFEKKKLILLTFGLWWLQKGDYLFPQLYYFVVVYWGERFNEWYHWLLDIHIRWIWNIFFYCQVSRLSLMFGIVLLTWSEQFENFGSLWFFF